MVKFQLPGGQPAWKGAEGGENGLSAVLAAMQNLKSRPWGVDAGSVEWMLQKGMWRLCWQIIWAGLNLVSCMENTESPELYTERAHITPA